MVKNGLLDRSFDVKNNKALDAVSRNTNNCKEITTSPVGALFGQVIILFLGGAGNSDHMIRNNNHMLSYIIKREQRLALKCWSLTALKAQLEDVL